MDDLISRKALLAEYDRVHIGPPGGARKLIEVAPAVQQWISVKDRLPEMPTIHKRYRHMYMKSIRVLCVCVQKDGKTMVKEGYCELWDDFPEPIWKIPGTIDSVTHWMPLPEPPKENNRGLQL